LEFGASNQSPPVGPQARKLLNEIMLAHVHLSSETGDLAVRQADLPRPPAAGGAALPFVKNRHSKELSLLYGTANELNCNFNVKSLEQSGHSLAENRARVSSFYPGMRQCVWAHFRVEQREQTKCHSICVR
jgi:hypothetical protein